MEGKPSSILNARNHVHELHVKQQVVTYIEWHAQQLPSPAQPCTVLCVSTFESENSHWVASFTVAWPFPLSHEHGYVQLEWRCFLSKLQSQISREILHPFTEGLFFELCSEKDTCSALLLCRLYFPTKVWILASNEPTYRRGDRFFGPFLITKIVPLSGETYFLGSHFLLFCTVFDHQNRSFEWRNILFGSQFW